MLRNRLCLTVVFFLLTSSSLADPTVRLVDGSNRCRGRVEVYHSDQWGTVCDDDWDMADAEVLCRQLGCGRATEIKTGAAFGPGTGQIWMDNVGCSGSECSLMECSHGGFGKHNCDHSEDAGVVCSDPTVRLVNGSSRCSGRVEVYHSDQWGTVCDDGWDMADAEVVCKQLGCGSAAEIKKEAAFGPGIGQIWMDNVGCSGSECSLMECSHKGFGKHNCGHQEDAGVVCSDPTVRLVNGSSGCSGRVEVYHSNQWGTVCDDSWDMADAEVLCRQLGCGSAADIKTGAAFGPGIGQIWMDNVGCSGSECSLVECSHEGFGKHNCDHKEDAGVVCSGKMSMRLVDGSSGCSGRVEVYHSNQWGTVCDDSWDMTDAEVLCRQLGCGSAAKIKTGAAFGPGTDPIWMDDVGCSGSECSLMECSHGGFGTHNCGHSEDAGVVCSDHRSLPTPRLSSSHTVLSPGDELSLTCSHPSQLDVRLVNGSNGCSGRVEVYHSNQWGTVCDDDWDMTDAEVVCRQLGCGSAAEIKTGAAFGPGIGQIWMDDVGCSGSECSLMECSHKGFGKHNCDHKEDAGVVCSALSPSNELSLTCSHFSQLCDPIRINFYQDGSPRGNQISGFGLTSATFTVSNIESSHQGSYTCRLSTQQFTSPYSTLVSITVVSPQQPNISLTTLNKGPVWGTQGPEVTAGHNFIISCSVSPQYPGGVFYLSFSGSNNTDVQSAVSHSASFYFPVAEYRQQGDYSCVYQVNVSTRTFTSKASEMLTVTVRASLLPRRVIGVVGGLLLLLVLLIVSFLIMRRRRHREVEVKTSGTNRVRNTYQLTPHPKEANSDQDDENLENFTWNQENNDDSNDFENYGDLAAVGSVHTRGVEKNNRAICPNTETYPDHNTADHNPGGSSGGEWRDEDGGKDDLCQGDFSNGQSDTDSAEEEEKEIYVNYAM
ncbi:deleted in malignant brain tumors 1 protein-like [Lampris incognitus]|uniref:deleted in malignant brain tumors 1 protein-like n=1 Tax=Lampris incognitus TaxID=2546036 RepID=UPI0024B495B0|nr:deleted in malignant brain tumors 1 protein-like [Lampris incognitus]